MELFKVCTYHWETISVDNRLTFRFVPGHSGRVTTANSTTLKWKLKARLFALT